VTTPSDLQMEDWAHQTLGLGSYPAEFSALTTEQALDTFQQLLCDVAPGLGEGLAQECPELIAPSGEPKLMSLTPTGMHLVSAKQEICESPVMPPRQRLIQTAALPMSAFTPLAKEEGTSQQSNPLYTLHILKEPPPEVTKMVYNELQLQLTNANGDTIEEFRPTATLVYEDGNRVQSISGHEVLEGMQTVRDGICILRVRINELSKAHRNQRFKVRITATGSFGQVVAFTTPMRVLSKTSIILQHQAAMSSEDSDSPRKRGKRKQSDAEIDDEEAKRQRAELQEIRTLCLKNQLQLNAMQQRTTFEITELKSAIAGLGGQLKEIKDLLLAMQNREIA